MQEYQLAFDAIDVIRGVSQFDLLHESVCHAGTIQKCENVTAKAPEPDNSAANAAALSEDEGSKKSVKRRLDEAQVVVDNDGFQKPSKHLVIEGNSGRRANNVKCLIMLLIIIVYLVTEMYLKNQILMCH